MTDAQQSSDEGEEEEVEDAAASAEPADGAGGDSIGGRNPALRAAAAAVAAAAAAAVAAAAAGAEGESARCWNKDMVSLAATAQMHMQAGKVRWSGVEEGAEGGNILIETWGRGQQHRQANAMGGWPGNVKAGLRELTGACRASLQLRSRQESACSTGRCSCPLLSAPRAGRRNQ